MSPTKKDTKTVRKGGDQEAPEVIQVPKPARTSFDPSRPLAKNPLLLAQVKHFHAVDQHLPDEQRTNIVPHEIQTEGEASEYIRQVTARLHPKTTRREKVRKAP